MTKRVEEVHIAPIAKNIEKGEEKKKNVEKSVRNKMFHPQVWLL